MIAAVVVNGVVPVWVHPKSDAERQLAHPPEPDDVRRRLQEPPDAKGMMLITPTDWGTGADIRTVARVRHELDVPLIGDEAWGAHLPFHPLFFAGNPGLEAGRECDLRLGGAKRRSSLRVCGDGQAGRFWFSM
ncbi:hypothetical protein [Streptomyces sp. NPDC005209]|uniref:hypothetical protein n=1 Tax=Streptomyces sp. NPDC005209 TaxID=3156715 RepID=UPI0033B006C8